MRRNREEQRGATKRHAMDLEVLLAVLRLSVRETQYWFWKICIFFTILFLCFLFNLVIDFYHNLSVQSSC